MAQPRILAIAAAVILVPAIGYGVSYSYGLHQKVQNADAELASSTAAFEARVEELERKLEEVKAENDSITGTLSDEQKKNLALEREKRRNERKIDTLTKLTTIDPELLKKYSKVYFLSENYVPPELEDIESKYLIDPSRQLQILEEVEPFLEDLLQRAERDGIDLRVASAYRSFREQQALKSGYRVQYGTGANSFSAEQGYSEHQLGTTVDFTTSVLRGTSVAFENTAAFAWLKKHAHNYGFILSYPRGNQYYVYEPWHWRFVGEELADHLDNAGLHFYEMDQREIDEYLISIFD